MDKIIDKRLTRKQKEANNKQWYKDCIDGFGKLAFSNTIFDDSDEGTISEYKKMKVNYDLYNNKIDPKDFEYVCSPYGKEVGKLPIDFTNKDIISGKVKALLGMEAKRPFSWKVVAVNEDATTRKEEEYFGMIRDYVIQEIMAPIQQEMQAQQQQMQAQQAQGGQASQPEGAQPPQANPEGGEQMPPEQEGEQAQQQQQEQQAQQQQQMEQEMAAKTPPEVKRYMEREHQDPAEVMASQILEYLIEKQDLRSKFNKAWKHGLISGREIFWVGGINGEPTVKVINPLRFDYDRASEIDYIEDGEWACYEQYMAPTRIIREFGDELSNKDIDDLYANYGGDSYNMQNVFTFKNDYTDGTMGIRVLHCEWKALKPVKFVTGFDAETGEDYEMLVDEEYELNRDAGDYQVKTKWIVTKYEGYKIGKDKYAFMREVPGQYKDLDNLHICKLSYIGGSYDNLNSEVTSLVDRMKYYQYMYNVLMYKIELLISSDEGKTLLLNAGLIPKSSNLTTEQWMYHFKVNKIGLMDPTEEGSRGQDITQAAKEIDLSLVSDIQKYIQLADYLERRCGESVGITKQIEGQIGNNEAVRNTQQAIVQSANILEPYFELHNNIKKNVLQYLIDLAKTLYVLQPPKSLNYILDDLSVKTLMMDTDLLDISEYGIFVTNSMRSDEVLQVVQQLSHAALQNQKIELSDVIKVMRSQSVPEAESILKAAEKQTQESMQQAQQQQAQQQKEIQQQMIDWEKEKLALEHKNRMEEIELRGEYDLKRQVILSLGFNQDKDLDRDGIPDILEVYKAGVNADIKAKQLDLEAMKIQQKAQEHQDKMDIEREKIATDRSAKSNIVHKLMNKD